MWPFKKQLSSPDPIALALRTLARVEETLACVARPTPSFVSLILIGKIASEHGPRREAHHAARILGVRLGADEKDVEDTTIFAGASELFCGEPGESKCLELYPQRPIWDAYAVVLCDTSRVGVQVFKGTDLMAAAVGDCPLARIGDVPLGIKVRALAYLRVPK